MNQKSRDFSALGLNMLLIVATASVLGWLAMWLLGLWTGHGKYAVVPDVQGLYYDEAYNLLRAGGFEVELSDSIYDTGKQPGAVVDQNPHQNAKVKQGRLIYLTINAFSPKKVTLPRLTDVSARQARAILEGLGIKQVDEVPVESEYQDLVLGALCDGRHLMPGARVPVTARITLEVGTLPPDTVPVDSIAPYNDKIDLF